MLISFFLQFRGLFNLIRGFSVPNFAFNGRGCSLGRFQGMLMNTFLTIYGPSNANKDFFPSFVFDVQPSGRSNSFPDPADMQVSDYNS